MLHSHSCDLLTLLLVFLSAQSFRSFLFSWTKFQDFDLCCCSFFRLQNPPPSVRTHRPINDDEPFGSSQTQTQARGALWCRCPARYKIDPTHHHSESTHGSKIKHISILSLILKTKYKYIRFQFVLNQNRVLLVFSAGDHVCVWISGSGVVAS